jgi:hypothetical protein
MGCQFPQRTNAAGSGQGKSTPYAVVNISSHRCTAIGENNFGKWDETDVVSAWVELKAGFRLS